MYFYTVPYLFLHLLACEIYSSAINTNCGILQRQRFQITCILATEQLNKPEELKKREEEITHCNTYLIELHTKGSRQS